jgi:hypothetical protein
VVKRLVHSAKGQTNVVCKDLHNHRKPNLSTEEFQAINHLKLNSAIVIKPADKGGAVVVMDSLLYKTEGLRQLENEHFYEPILIPPWETNIASINSTLHKMKLEGFISDKQLEYLRAKMPLKPRPFYLLPKVHKSRSKWPHPSMPEGRPIVADCGSETYAICELIDHFLKPLANKHRAYLRDSYDFVEKITAKPISANAFICTADVTALYPNMNIDRSIEVVSQAFANNPDSKRPDKHILDLLSFSLKHNEFTFANKYYRQVCGTAMGKKYAPSLADLYLMELDHMAMNGFHLKPAYYFRYLDDIFFVWEGTRIELNLFMEFLNSVIPGIKLTVNIKQSFNEFLDITIYKNLIGTQYSLATTVFFKPTDTHQLLHAYSHHPKHTCRGILKSQLLRFKRLGCTLFQYNKAANLVFRILAPRGYSKRLFRSLKNQIWYRNENTIPREDKEPSLPLFPIINYFDPISTHIMRETRAVLADNPIIKNQFRVIQAYKTHSNLAKMLTRSLFTD